MRPNSLPIRIKSCESLLGLFNAGADRGKSELAGEILLSRGLSQFLQQVPRRKQVSGLETLGESVVNRSENSFSFVLPFLFYPHTGEAERRSQFPKKGLLFSSQSDRTEETTFGCRHRIGWCMPEHHLAFDAKEFGNRVTLATVFGGRQGFLDGDG